MLFQCSNVNYDLFLFARNTCDKMSSESATVSLRCTDCFLFHFKQNYSKCAQLLSFLSARHRNHCWSITTPEYWWPTECCGTSRRSPDTATHLWYCMIMCWNSMEIYSSKKSMWVLLCAIVIFLFLSVEYLCSLINASFFNSLWYLENIKLKVDVNHSV